MHILFLGQLIGKNGITFLKKHLQSIKTEWNIDVTIGVADAVTGGYSLGKNHAFYLKKLGVDILVGGESLFLKKDLVEELDNINFLVRPANFTGIGNFGYGSRHVLLPNGKKLNIINIMGLMGFHRVHAGNPYHTAMRILENKKDPSIFNIITFSAIASAEKQTMAHLVCNSQCSAVIGYGAKAITGDAQIINNMAYITDLGRISPPFSVGGLDPENEIIRYKTQRPRYTKEMESSEIELQGLIVTLDPKTGHAININPLRKIYSIASTDA